MELHEFMDKVLNEDEEVARAALASSIEKEWTSEKHYGDIYAIDLRTSDTGSDLYIDAVADADGYLPQDVYDYFQGNIADHIARFDPARILSEVTAKRELVGMYKLNHEQVQHDLAVGGLDNVDDYDRGQAGAFDDVLRALALPYSSHPDYNPDWSL